ncbi:hypothetical protein V6N12_061898 [Hibiscus sabdariffa]|uniref:Uncharacterized protein n=1 Tax=Hibiscus sabdariffa TaxID=183260 RepID=A0ABR2DYE4_9ROSI
MGLALPLAILVAVRAGKIPALNSLNMEEEITNLTLEVLKEEIVNHLFILYEVYRDTTPMGDGDLPEGVNFHDVSERVLFSVDNIQWLNHIYIILWIMEAEVNILSKLYNFLEGRKRF